jgi:SAM-dependent methyltransferase
MTPEVPAWLPSHLLRCVACHATDFATHADVSALTCRRCGAGSAIDAGVVHVETADEDRSVRRERQAVRDIEEALAPSVISFTFEDLMGDAGELRQAMLSLPYGARSRYFEHEGYFVNVRKFASEFDFIMSHLPLPPGAFVLDVGADLTWSTARLAARGWRPVGIDINHHLRAARLFRQTGLSYATVNVDMHAPAFADAAFDAVTAFNALHHSHRIELLARNLARVLKPGGRLAFIEPFCRNEDERQEFGRAQIEAGINENVYLIEEWHQALARAGLRLKTCLLATGFNGIYEKPSGPPAEPFPSLDAARDDFFGRFYQSRLRVPASLPAPVAPGATFHVPVVVENRSGVSWSSRGGLPILLSYHRYRLHETVPELTAFDNPRTPLPAFVHPGESVELSVQTQAPAEPGDGLLVFDLVQESRTWFADQGGGTAALRFVVG